MKNKFVNIFVNYIANNKKCSDVELEQLRYGFASLYIQITKTIVITLLAIIFKLIYPYLVFLVAYNIIRKPSFGMHANKSWECWIWSIALFLVLPYLSLHIYFNQIIKQVLCIIGIIFIFKNAPADTKKKPIVSNRRREIYKFSTTIISIIYSFLIIYISNQIIANCLLFALLLQNIIISPLTYKIFKQPYNNYISYISKEEMNC